MFQEPLFVTSGATGDKQQVMCTALDFRTGTNLLKYKASNDAGASANSLNIVQNQYVMAANANKPLVHIWPINSQEQVKHQRYVVPGPATALAMSPDNCFLVAAIKETLYIWNTHTGRLCTTVTKHFQTINCLRFVGTGSHFASGGKDGMVMVWNLSQLVSFDAGDRINEALYSFNDHGLPVIDIHIGIGGLRAYLYSVSLDRTCKIYDLSTGTLLLTVVFRTSLHSVIVDSMEHKVFVGTSNGKIHDFNIGKAPRMKHYHLEDDAVAYIGHAQDCLVNCLALSHDSETLISGGSDGQIMIWNICSHQLYKTFKFNGGITNLCVHLTNPMTFNVENKPVDELFCAKLQRIVEPVQSYENEITEIMVRKSAFEEEDANRGHRLRSLMEFNERSLQSANSVPLSNVSEELENLRAEVARLHRINRELFTGATELLLAEDTSAAVKSKKRRKQIQKK